MAFRSLILRFLALAGGSALAWAAAPNSGDAAIASWRPSTAAPASFLQQGPGTVWASARGGGSGRNHLPTSVMPNGTVGLQCSVDTIDLGAPPSCSTTNAAVRCSAHCDNAQRCSAFAATAGIGPTAICSTLGGVSSSCSVLQPVIQGAGPSQCSAFGGIPGTDIQCSVMGPGFKQACSAQNQARFPNNQCSTFGLGPVGGIVQCSVLRGGPAQPNYCSVGNAVQPGFQTKTCSTYVQASRCSVLPGSRGFCTTFAPAPAGSCSAFVAGTNCSVIGGLNGAFCRWP